MRVLAAATMTAVSVSEAADALPSSVYSDNDERYEIYLPPQVLIPTTPSSSYSINHLWTAIRWLYVSASKLHYQYLLDESERLVK